MDRRIVESEAEAYADLTLARTKPAWRESRHALPFVELSSDEFEVCCFLLLRAEFAGERIYYYGKTADGGRDIVHIRPDGTVRLIQCKRYSANVNLSVLKLEIAKLFSNVFLGTIPKRPDEVVFYVVPDMTSPACKLFEAQNNWTRVANQAIQSHLKREVPADLLVFAADWWPTWDRDNAFGITERISKLPALRDEFFAVRKVVDASRADVRHDLREEVSQIRRDVRKEIGPVRDMVRQLLSNQRSDAPTIAGDASASLNDVVRTLFEQLGLPVSRSDGLSATKLAAESLEQSAVESGEIARLVEARLIGEFSRALNVPASALLQVSNSHEPPPLPSCHVSRPDVVNALRSQLEGCPVAVMVGYEECGKSTALAEFAGQQPRECFWFSTPPAPVSGESTSAVLLSFAVSSFLTCGSIAAGEIAEALRRRIVDKPLLIVIDDAHCFGNLAAIDFLLDIALGQPEGLRIVLSASDSSTFATQARRRPVTIFRMPGLGTESACELFRSLGTEVTSAKRNAIALLCARCDGHIGLLRLAAIVVRSAGATAVGDLTTLAETLGPSASQMLAALVSRFCDSLDDKGLQLCKRLTIALRPFQRRLAVALCSQVLTRDEFQQAWNQSVVSVFEAHFGDRYSLPDLYRNGLQEYCDPAELAHWHGIAADALEQPVGTSFDILDAHDSVVHRLLSGAQDTRWIGASHLLAIAMHGKRPDVLAFLFQRFDSWLKDVASSGTTPMAERIRWYSISALVTRDLGRNDQSSAEVLALHGVLRLAAQAVEPSIVHFGWIVVLLHASRVGLPPLAIEAADQIETLGWQDSNVETHQRDNGVEKGWREFSILSAYIVAGENPLPYLQGIFDKLEKAPTSPDSSPRLWSRLLNYELWRTTIHRACRSIEQAAKADGDSVRSATALIAELVRKARDHGEREIATLLSALLVLVEIDVKRDYAAAASAAEEMVRHAEHDDERLTAYAHDTYGDSLRCQGRCEEAVNEYDVAMQLWPKPERFDRAESLLMRGICLARQERFREAAKSARLAAKTYISRNRCLSELGAARCLLEAACFSMGDGRPAAAVRCLVLAHSLMNRSHRHCAEWAALGQIAWSIADRSDTSSEKSETPAPGFTLGLKESVDYGENMVPFAHNVYVSARCAEVELPFRALSYYDSALSECVDNERRGDIGALALGTALKASDLPRAARYAAFGSCWIAHLPPAPSSDRRAIVLDYQVASVVRLAAGDQDEGQTVEQLDLAIAAIDSTQVSNPPTTLLRRTLVAYRSSLTENSDTPIQDVFDAALAAGALVVARDSMVLVFPLLARKSLLQ